MQNALARVRNPALRQGLTFGIILGILLLLRSLAQILVLSGFFTFHIPISILLAINFILTNFYITLFLILIASFLAGTRASQETGRITTGTLAGLWTGLIGMFIPSIISVIFVLVNIDSYLKSLQAAADKQHQHITYTNSMVLTGLLINILFLLIIGIIPGAIGGLLGGIFGSRRAQVPPVEEYKVAMFEPPSASEVEELPAASESEVPSSSAEAEKSPSVSETGEPLSETPLKESPSSTQQAE